MQIPETTPIDLPIYMDSTMLSAWKSCKYKWYIAHGRNLRPPGSNIHLTAGGALAAGTEAARRAQFGRSDPLAVDDLMHAAIGPFLREWKDCPSDPEHPKNIHNTLHALERYFTNYHPLYDPAQPLRRADGTPTTEFTFSIPLEIDHPSGVPFIYCGRFDLLGRYTDNGRLVILDEKTTGSLGAYWARQWDMRGQFIGYIWACRKLGYEIEDVLVRGIGIMKTDIVFMSVPLRYSESQLLRWERDLYAELDMLKHFHKENYYPQNWADACSSYGGCPFTDLCKHNDPEQWTSNYETHIWSPLKAAA